MWHFLVRPLFFLRFRRAVFPFPTTRSIDVGKESLLIIRRERFKRKIYTV